MIFVWLLESFLTRAPLIPPGMFTPPFTFRKTFSFTTFSKRPGNQYDADEDDISPKSRTIDKPGCGPVETVVDNEKVDGAIGNNGDFICNADYDDVDVVGAIRTK